MSKRTRMPIPPAFGMRRSDAAFDTESATRLPTPHRALISLSLTAVHPFLLSTPKLTEKTENETLPFSPISAFFRQIFDCPRSTSSSAVSLKRKIFLVIPHPFCRISTLASTNRVRPATVNGLALGHLAFLSSFVPLSLVIPKWTNPHFRRITSKSLNMAVE